MHIMYCIVRCDSVVILLTNTSHLNLYTQIDPQYIEYFYDELIPMKHYIPASLDNITNVTEYAIDERNENEMIRIVASANAWCKSNMNRDALAQDMMQQLHKNRVALDEYSVETYNNSISAIDIESDLDLVECIYEGKDPCPPELTKLGVPSELMNKKVKLEQEIKKRELYLQEENVPSFVVKPMATEIGEMKKDLLDINNQINNAHR